MWQKHSSAAVSCESECVKNFTNILLLLHLFSSFSHQFTELIPLVSDNLTTTETTDWNNHAFFSIFLCSTWPIFNFFDIYYYFGCINLRYVDLKYWFVIITFFSSSDLKEILICLKICLRHSNLYIVSIFDNQRKIFI